MANCRTLLTIFGVIITLGQTSRPTLGHKGQRELKEWFNIQKKHKVQTFCSQDRPNNINECLKLVEKIDDCRSVPSGIKQTSFDKQFLQGWPHGKGLLTVNRNKIKSIEGPCLKALKGVKSVYGSFKKGLLDGRIIVTLDDDSYILTSAVDGVLHGTARLFGRDNGLEMVGTYNCGQLHGPTWFNLDNGYDNQDDKLLVWYNIEGKMGPKATYLNGEGRIALQGHLTNGSILATQRVEMIDILEQKCIKYPNFEPVENEGQFHLPMKVIERPNYGARVFPSQFLIYNRIAKTGSQGFISLMLNLQDTNKYKVYVKLLPKETLMEPFNEVQKVVQEVNKIKGPKVVVRHYNFIDFEEHKSERIPDYFNVVRRPVDRIISWFYYWRSAWNVVNRMLSYPEEPVPSPEYLRMDFDTCVLERNPECNFSEGTDGTRDHISQMTAFCGHQPFCKEFNSEKVLKAAIRNVERYYPVVGVMEELNKTLTVMEAKMPLYFKGAKEVYHRTVSEQNKLKNAFKLPVAEEVMNLVKANFTREIEFYEYCRQRLDRQYKEYVRKPR